MTRDPRPGHRRAGPLFGAALLVVTATLAFTPAVPPVGAIDPTPAPSVDPIPDPTPAPTPDPTPDPTPAPTPDPTPDPTPAPTADACGASLQERINAASAGSILDLSGCSYDGSVTVAKPITLRGAALTVPPGASGIVVTSDDVTLDGVHISGQPAAASGASAAGIAAVGTEADPIRRLTISNSLVEQFSDAAIRVRFVDEVTISGNVLRDTGRAGLEILSGENGVVVGNLVQRIGSADAGDPGGARGIVLAQHGSDPPTTAFVVVGNVVTDIPDGSALATDGGRRILWAANTVLRARSPFVVTGTAERSAADNDLDGNTAYGWPGADWAFSSTHSTRGFIRNNTIAGWPEGREIRTADPGDPAATAVDLGISGNAITSDPGPTEDPAPSIPATLPSPPPPAPGPSPEPSPEPSPSPKPSPDPTAPPPTVGADLEITTNAPTRGRHRVNPGSEVEIGIAATMRDAARAGWLVLDVPPGWTVVDAGGGAEGRGPTTVTWSLGDLPAGAEVGAATRLRAPRRDAPGQAAAAAALTARLGHAEGTAAIASADILVAPPIVVEHSVLGEIEPGQDEVRYNDPDVDLGGIVRFDRVRVRFQLRNADLAEVAIEPRLQVAVDGGPFTNVPAGDDEGIVHLAAEWRPGDDGDGTLPGPELESIAIDELRVPDVDNPSQRPVAGRRVMGADAGGAVVLAGDAYTEIEFTVKVSRALAPRSRLQLRLTDEGRPLDGAAVATLLAAAQVAPSLSPGQRNGIPVGPPVDVRPAALGEVDYPLLSPAAVTAATWPEANAEPQYQLAVAVPIEPAQRYLLNAPFTSPHTPDYSLVADTCAACHRAHAAQGPVLAAEPAPQASMCFACHDGSGSEIDVEARYADPSVPANDPGTAGTTRSAYYRHDAVTVSAPPTGHSLTTDNEFEGVLNRHSVCADCHNAHSASTTPSTQMSDGWTVSGRQASVSGVAVAHAAAPGAAPTYTFLAGTAGSQPTREYEVCLKCHSGWTELASPDPAFPSTWALDKGIEINPANGSYHPIAAPGTSRTPQMAWSLANSSPYKQWNFTTESTVRCVHCHGDPAKFNAAAPPDPGSDLAPHVSANRGLLFQPYRDRLLKGATEPYNPTDFALCYVCHAEQPFRSGGQAITRFPYHDVHVSGMAGMGPGGTDIDTPGAGGGRAICAECHFRTHSTAEAYDEGDRGNTGLVNFAPNVLPFDGVVDYTRTTTGGTCTLVCHGQPHENEAYP